MIWVLLWMSIPLAMQAGNDKFTEAMKGTISMMDTATTSATFQNCANRFERIGNAEKKEWLPHYYAGFCYVMMSYLEPDVSKVDAILDKAQAEIDAAGEMKIKDGEKSEIMVIKGMILSARIRVEPQTRGMQMGPQSGMMYDRARQLNPGNPRALSMVGQNTMFTPEMFGGGREKAIPILESAVAAFETFEPLSEIHPVWGKENTVGILEFARTGKKMEWEEDAGEDQPSDSPEDGK